MLNTTLQCKKINFIIIIFNIIFIQVCNSEGNCRECNPISEGEGARYYHRKLKKCLPCNIPYSDMCTAVKLHFY